MADILKISIEDSDSILQPDNIPSMVILTIEVVGGKKIQIPYKAKNTVAQMCVDAAKAGESAVDTKGYEKFTPGFEVLEKKPVPLLRSKIENGIIQTGDLVKCISTGHKAGINELKTGSIYQVLNPTETGFDVFAIDAEIQTRIAGDKKDFELYQKHVKGAEKKQNIKERIYNCPDCKQEASMLLDRTESFGICDCGSPTEKKFYSGECSDCGKNFIREIVECTNDPDVCKRMVKKNA